MLAIMITKKFVESKEVWMSINLNKCTKTSNQ